MEQLTIIIVVIVGGTAIGVPLFYIGKFIFRKDLKNTEKSRAVSSKELAITFASIAILVALLWLGYAGHKWAGILAISILVVSYIIGMASLLKSKHKNATKNT